jgi:hypothetical protein
MKKLTESAGWAGLALIHGATLPTTLGAIFAGATTFPPLSMVLMVWAGLFLFLIQACAARNILYISSNAIGFALQTALLAIMVFGG